MSLFGLFGDDDSQQRRNQILAYFMQEQQRQAEQIRQQNLNAYLSANQPQAASTPAAPTVDPTVASAVDNEKALSDYRAGLTRDLDTTYGNDYSYKTFADTADDPIINTILSRQRSGAQTTLDMAKQRGQLNTAGYNAAISGLNDAQTAATSDANTVGGAVLSRYRQNLDDALASLRSGASGASLNSFDLEGGKTGIANRVTDMNKNLSGDVSAAVGAKNYFDTGKILGTAGTQQGYVNPGANAVADPTAAGDLRRRRTNTSQVF
jgi:hypothetical protein